MTLQPVLFEIGSSSNMFGYHSNPAVGLPQLLQTWNPWGQYGDQNRHPYRRLRSPSPQEEEFDLVIPDDFWEPVIPDKHNNNSNVDNTRHRYGNSSNLYHCGYDQGHSQFNEYNHHERSIPIKIEHIITDDSRDFRGQGHLRNENNLVAGSPENRNNNGKIRSQSHTSRSERNARTEVGKGDVENFRHQSHLRNFQIENVDEPAAACSKSFTQSRDFHIGEQHVETKSSNKADQSERSKPLFTSRKPNGHKYILIGDDSDSESDSPELLSYSCKNDHVHNDMTKTTEDFSIMRETNSVTSTSNSALGKSRTVTAKAQPPQENSFSPDLSLPAIVPPPSYPAYKTIRHVISEFGGQVDYIRGDGNCFFRALSKVIYGSEMCHEEVRQAVVDFIEKYPKEFEQFVDKSAIHEHIIEMRNPGTWATQAEIYAAATLLQRDIYVLSPDHKGDNYRWLLFMPRFRRTNKDFHKCHITLCHTNGNHYDRIAPPSGDCNCGLAPPKLSGVKVEVDLTDEDCVV